ncbi:MAG: hypothetical protein JWO85_857 [Candidatus Eremiobacteraeota bacterium]|jgi:hypothetical protein|nr:hypothetical protein [Candidatus Eremiobacteraeota bacterium]
MFVRRFLAGVLLAGLAASTLAAAPRDSRQTKADQPATPPPGMGVRVFARADAHGEVAQAPSPAAAASGAPASGAGPAGPSLEIAQRARAEFEAHRAGKIDRSHYTPEMNGVITDARLAEAATELQTLGMVKSFVQVRRITHGGSSMYVFRIECDNAPVVEETIGWNADGKVDYLAFGPVR